MSEDNELRRIGKFRLKYGDVTRKLGILTTEEVFILITPEKFKLPVEVLSFLLETKWKKSS